MVARAETHDLLATKYAVMSADVDAVVIGAGAAGIAAARRLAASHSAIVLEATARVGGRAWTCEVAGMGPIGCGWCIRRP